MTCAGEDRSQKVDGTVGGRPPKRIPIVSKKHVYRGNKKKEEDGTERTTRRT